MSLRAAFLKKTNKMMSEGELRNVLVEIKRLKEPLLNLAKRKASTSTELCKWSASQTTKVHEFIKSMTTVDQEIVDALQHYEASYEAYIGRWNTILVARKDLSHLESEYAKAEKAVASARKKLEHQAKRGSVVDVEAVARAAEDGEASAGEADPGSPTKKGKKAQIRNPGHNDKDFTKAIEHQVEVGDKLHVKELEVEREIHDELRRGCYDLNSARMRLLQACTSSVERQLGLVYELPNVTGRAEEGGHVFEYGPFEENLEAVDTTWANGEQLARTLEIERQAAREAIQADQEKHRKELKELKERLQGQLSELRDELASARKEHQDLLESLKAAAEAKEMSLEDRANNLAAQLTTVNTKVAGFKKAMTSSFAAQLELIGSVADSLQEAPIATAITQCDRALTVLEELPSTTFESVTGFFKELTGLSACLNHAVILSHGASTGVSVDAGRAILEQARKLPSAATSLFTEANTGMETLAEAEGSTGSFKFSPDSASLLISELQALNAALAASQATAGSLPSAMEQKITSAQRLVRDALDLIQRLTQSVNSNEEMQSQLKELYQKLLKDCEAMMNTAIDFIRGAIDLQKLFDTEEYKSDQATAALEIRHWLGAVEQCVNNVVENTPVWTECLRSFVESAERAEELQVSSKELSASTAQLMAFVKTLTRSNAFSHRDSELVIEGITQASTRLIKTSHKVINDTKDVSNCLMANSVLSTENLASLTPMQGRRMLMRSQVEVLRLEKALEMERTRLGELRRQLGGLLKEEDRSGTI
eukprot:m.104302 g.104302  ORF g.104302 m.104302 type:complete len:770 (-) comp15235_c0_seq1:83-2392(-)